MSSRQSWVAGVARKWDFSAEVLQSEEAAAKAAHGC